jgi:Fur family peroxide stress response transcriptional regulator
MKATAQILKEKGLKVTPQRIAVYNMLLNTTEHPNAETIYKALEPTNPTISLATVYKTLDYFKQLGLVQELNVGEGSSRYDAVVKCHPHTVCVQCGKVQDLYLEELTEIHKKVAEELDFEVRCEQLILYGTCGECRRKNKDSDEEA